MNKWQRTIEELMTVFKSQEDLLAALNDMLGDNPTNRGTISRIRSGETTKVYHDLGQALLILHVRYIPIREKENTGEDVQGGVSTST